MQQFPEILVPFLLQVSHSQQCALDLAALSCWHALL